MITVDKATPTLKLTDPGGAYDGNLFPASVRIAGVGEDNSPAASLAGGTPALTDCDGADTAGTSRDTGFKSSTLTAPKLSKKGHRKSLASPIVRNQ
jgi:hypothetical protein